MDPCNRKSALTWKRKQRKKERKYLSHQKVVERTAGSKQRRPPFLHGHGKLISTQKRVQSSDQSVSIIKMTKANSWNTYRGRRPCTRPANGASSHPPARSQSSPRRAEGKGRCTAWRRAPFDRRRWFSRRGTMTGIPDRQKTLCHIARKSRSTTD